jgi:uncharacterized protein YukE
MINNINVADCEFLGYCNICKLKSASNCPTDCKENPNCYYKQLKAKEQECEELQNIIDEAKNSKLDLKSFLVGEAIQNEYEQQLDQLKTENKHLNDLLNQALKELEKTRETLTEIKKICNKESGWVNCSNNMPTETAIFAEQILQKISECEGKDE